MPLDPKQAFTLSVDQSCPDDFFFTTRSLISFHLKTIQKTIIWSLLAVCTYLVSPRNGLPSQLWLTHSLPRSMMMTLPLSCTRLCCLLSVMTLRSGHFPAKIPSTDNWMTLSYVSPDKNQFHQSWNRFAIICVHNGNLVQSSSHHPTRALPCCTYSILSLFCVKLSIRVSWPMELLNRACSLS